MDTAPGGENTQYESIKEFTKPHKKESGQMGDPTDTSTTKESNDEGAANSVGITPAEKIRYGQALQEGGMGGKTAGGLEDSGVDEVKEGDGARAAQGYGSGTGIGG